MCSSDLKWASGTHLTVVESERALVSERYRFGGRLDAMLVDDDLSLGDWKSANAVYADYLLQLAAYGISLWAMLHAPVAAVSALRETSVIFAAIIGATLLRERLGAWRIGTATLVATGIVLLRW